MSLLQRSFFYPSLFYNVIIEKLTSRLRYNRIDEFVVLGGLPFNSLKFHLINNENVRGIVTLNEDFELENFVPTEHEWRSSGVDYLQLPTVDFTASPSQQHINDAVSFINEHRSNGDTVYVHCKAGRTRSATIVACYMMLNYGMTPSEAVEDIKQKRPQIWLRQTQMDSIINFYETNCHKDSNHPKVL